jgi:hydroxymethylpyrimidine pyrophosphatase-like HAD family hydrolase
VSEALGVAREDTVGAGDGSNDLEMIEWVDHGIVMGQAGEPLKELASVVTGTVEEDGLATALIDHLGLDVLAEA